MRTGQSSEICAQLQRLLKVGSFAGLDDDQLLARFQATGDALAFEALIVRHGRMVFGVCRRVLSDCSDAEDAFQATFLILVKRRPRSATSCELLGAWLYGVAYRVAVRARRTAARRRVREQPEPGPEDAVASTLCDTDRDEALGVLDDELNRLPEKYRSPLVLCYLEGLTHDEAARRLRWPVGTVRSRMASGRNRLRDRLALPGRRAFGRRVRCRSPPPPVQRRCRGCSWNRRYER